MSVPRSLRASAATCLRSRAATLRGPALAASPLHTTTSTLNAAADQSRPSEYQTIGLAIFDGCELSHVPGFGATLSRVVAAGGPGVAAWRETTTTTGKTKTVRQGVEAAEPVVLVTGRRKVRLLDREDLFEGGEEAGVIKPAAILRLTDASFREYIADQVQLAKLSPSERVHVREQAVSIPAQPQTPSPKGIIHYTVNGPRILPIDIHTSLSVLPERPDKVTAEVHIFSAGGKGEYCGSCRAEYVLRSSIEGEGGKMKAVDARQLLEASDP